VEINRSLVYVCIGRQRGPLEKKHGCIRELDLSLWSCITSLRVHRRSVVFICRNVKKKKHLAESHPFTWCWVLFLHQPKNAPYLLDYGHAVSVRVTIGETLIISLLKRSSMRAYLVEAGIDSNTAQLSFITIQIQKAGKSLHR